MDQSNTIDDNQAANLIRQKLERLYQEEPSVTEEMAEAEGARHRSKHQRFMYDLSHSGKNLAQIQTEWHNYYVSLPDSEKHLVWREFYDERNRRSSTNVQPTVTEAESIPKPPEQPISHTYQGQRPRLQDRSLATIKQQIIQRVLTQTKAKSTHARSLMFGLACGSVVILLFLFGLFNERFIAPFITPSRHISNTPIIIDPANTKAGPEPELIIPKINAELPVVYTESSIEEASIQRALESGVVHYATTSNPGEKGNGAIFGHSSNNIFNRGKFKFAFVMLKRLEIGDTFILQKNSKRYVYRVYEKKIVSPEEVSVLGDQPGKAATFSLITCDPPGTSLKRLVVIGEQISPSPAKNVASTAKKDLSTPLTLPSNAPSLWQRFTKWMTR